MWPIVFTPRTFSRVVFTYQMDFRRLHRHMQVSQHGPVCTTCTRVAAAFGDTALIGSKRLVRLCSRISCCVPRQGLSGELSRMMFMSEDFPALETATAIQGTSLAVRAGRLVGPSILRPRAHNCHWCSWCRLSYTEQARLRRLHLEARHGNRVAAPWATRLRAGGSQVRN